VCHQSVCVLKWVDWLLQFSIVFEINYVEKVDSYMPVFVFKPISNLLYNSYINNTRMWANANVMAALPNIGGVLCSMSQFG